MPGLNNGSSQQNAFEWDHTQYPGGTRVFGATDSAYGTGNTQDWWAVYLLAGTIYVFQTRLPTAWQTQLYLYDSNGYFLAFSSSGGDDGYTLSKITYTVMKDDWYFLALTGNVYGGGFGPYALESVPAPKSFKTYATSAARFGTRAVTNTTVSSRLTVVKDPVIATQAAHYAVRSKRSAHDPARFTVRRERTATAVSRMNAQKYSTTTVNLCRYSPRAKVTNNMPSRLTVRALAARDVLARLAIRAHANANIVSRFAALGRICTHQIARHNAFIPPGWSIYARDTATGIATLLGFIPIDADPRELTDVAIPDGTFEIEVRPAQFFWQDARTRPVTTLITTPIAPPVTGIPAIQNLRAEIMDTQTAITWNISTDIAPAAGLQFGLWFSPTTPVNTNTPPHATAPFLTGAGEYQITRVQSAAEYVAVAGITPADQGPIAELFLPWSTDLELTPPNQLATTGPLT